MICVRFGGCMLNFIQLKRHQKKKGGPAAPGRAPTPLSNVFSQSPSGSSFSPAPSEAGGPSESGELSVAYQLHIHLHIASYVFRLDFWQKGATYSPHRPNLS